MTTPTDPRGGLSKRETPVIVGVTHFPPTKSPRAGAWVRTGKHPHQDPTLIGTPADIYDHPSGMRVLSSVDFIPPPEGKGLEYHVSISSMGGRANRAQVRQALADFGMPKEGEDNHFPGAARHFWMPVREAETVGCYCFETEEPIDEGEGFVWRREPNPND